MLVPVPVLLAGVVGEGVTAPRELLHDVVWRPAQAVGAQDHEVKLLRPVVVPVEREKMELGSTLVTQKCRVKLSA